MNKKVKVIVISSVSALLAVAILVGSLWYFGRSTNPVEVTPVSYHYSNGYGEEGVPYDGLVTADNLQAVYESDTQTITEIYVKEGQKVKKGDKLLSYDTTLSDIQLERQHIAVQQAELNLKQAKKELSRINSLKPYTPPPTVRPTQPTEPTEPSTEPLNPVDDLPYAMGGLGTEKSPYRWLWSENLSYDDAFINNALENESEVWLAFEIREKNSLNGAVLSRWGLHVMKNEDGSLSYAFYTPEDDPDYPDPTEPTAPPTEPTEDTTWIDTSSGYTAAEIAKMRADKQKEIRDIELEGRMAKVEYERMQNEVQNGIVYAKMDGTVLSLLDEETAKSESKPIMVISDGGCYYVKTFISEYDREKYPVGTEAKISSWSTGTQTTGRVESISDTPTDSYYYGNGNPNVSLYTAEISVDAMAGLYEGDYLSVTFGNSQSVNSTLYLENMYIRTENGKSYVYKRGEDGKLVKVNIRTGANLWGSYTAVYGDLTIDDYIAFPYGNDVKEGADTVESNDSEI